MSRDDRIELRDLPPVPPVRWPERLSMTLARWLDRCPRAGYLYVKTGGGAPSHAMDRGSLAHGAFARIMVDWMRAIGSEEPGEVGADFTPEEVARYQAQGVGYGGRSDEEISSLTAELVAEVERESPELEVKHGEKDVARLCAFHVALALDVNPADVIAVERKFVLELPCGWTISGKVDLASMPDAESGQVDDYKTLLAVPPKSEWDPFQQKLYAVLVIWGRPVDRVPCPNGCAAGAVPDPTRALIERIDSMLLVGPEKSCPVCRGRGTVEEVGEPLGGRLMRVTGRELYPRHDPRKRSDGKLARNEHTWTRLELQEFMLDLDRIGERLSERLQTWKFPARFGSWCGECPDEDACPIPRGYRRFAGHIRTLEEATEAWAWAQRMKVKVGETEAQVKAFAGDNAVQIESGDFVWEHELSEVKKLRQARGRTDWEGLEQAIEGALENGEEFKLADWIKVSNQSSFKKRKRPADAVGEDTTTEVRSGSDRDGAERPGLDERFGADAPY